MKPQIVPVGKVVFLTVNDIMLRNKELVTRSASCLKSEMSTNDIISSPLL